MKKLMVDGAQSDISKQVRTHTNTHLLCVDVSVVYKHTNYLMRKYYHHGHGCGNI